jgi:predicted RNA-binding protein with PUA-like domain
MRYWLLKTEAEEFSIDDLKNNKTTLWTGVRNYQARNFMTQDMKLGDRAIVYHSNGKPSAAVGIMEVSALATPDPTALDKKSDYFDPKASLENPIWYCTEFKFVKKFLREISLNEMRINPNLKNMLLLKKGSRLSITPLTENEFYEIAKEP